MQSRVSHRSHFTRWTHDYWDSIKSFDTEEKLDLYFYRPLGFLIAKVAQMMNLTPSHLSLLGLISGVYGGSFYYRNHSWESLFWGTSLFLLSGVFDSSDGQLARLSGQSSKMGLILDGVCDNFVFASVYIFSSLTLVPFYGYSIFVVTVLAGICHSFQSATLDFYNREYIYFGYGKNQTDSYWNPNLDEARHDIRDATGFWEKKFYQLRYSWLFQQHLIQTRTPEQRLLMKALSGQTEFQKLYKDQNRMMIRFWRLMGPNFHTIMIICFVFLKNFDSYLFYVDILSLNSVLLILRFFQKRKDQKLFQLITIRFPEVSRDLKLQ